MSLLIRNGDISTFESGAPDGGRSDILIAGGRIVEVGPDLPVDHRVEVIDAGGGVVIPGIHDHHVHLRALATARNSVVAGPPQVHTREQFAKRLSAASAALPPGRWLRVVGYHQSVAGDLDRWSLDELCPSRPLRVQHAGGSLWVVNSQAIDALRIDGLAPVGVERAADGRPTGRIWREDRWLATRVPSEPGCDLASVSRDAAAWGITGFTDATPGQRDGDLDGLAEAIETGEILQRLHVMADIGTRCPDTSLVTLGPVKVMLDDVALPTLDDLTELVASAHRIGRPVAVHCVTRVQGVLAVTAIGQAGCVPGDRIEHGAVLGADLLPSLRELGVTIVTQPGMLAFRGDRYLSDVDARDRPDLWRVASLASAGVRLAFSTDAPFGPADPWEVIRSAETRLAPSGAPVGRAEAVTRLEALHLFAGHPGFPSVVRGVRPGEPADLCVQDARHAVRWTRNGPAPIRATIVAGEVVYRAEGEPEERTSPPGSVSGS